MADDDRRDIERQVDEELEFHLEMRARENRAAGMDDESARRAALRRFGSVQTVREAGARLRRPPPRRRLARLVDDLRDDLRLALRGMVRAPRATAAVLLTLALGIGANAAMYGVLDAVVLRDLPYREPGGIVALYGPALAAAPATAWHGMESVESLAFVDLASPDLTGVAEPRRLHGMGVGEGFFPILGVDAELGRTFSAADHRPGASATAVIAYSLWSGPLGRDPAVVGSPIRLDGRPVVVVGVMPPGFRYLRHPDTEVWLATPRGDGRRGSAIARLADGHDLEGVRAEAGALAAAVAGDLEEGRTALQVHSLREYVLMETDEQLLALGGAVAMVLLIACANVANLSLSRLVGRRTEFAVRAALGAGRTRIARQVITESLLLAAGGGLLGVVLARVAVPGLLTLRPANVRIPRLDEVAVDHVVLGVALVASLAVGLVVGLVSVVGLRESGLRTALQAGGRSAGGDAGPRWFRSGLIVAEVALALVLAIGAGLFLRTYVRYLPSAPGFEFADRLTFEVAAGTSVADPAARAALFEEIERTIEALPGVEAVAATSILPFGPFSSLAEASSPGGGDAAPARLLQASVSPDLLDALGIPVVRGRGLQAADRGGPPVVLVSQAAAERLWPGQDPLGRTVEWNFLGLPDDRRAHTVVGVVADARLVSWAPDRRPAMWTPWLDPVEPRLSFVVKTAGDPRAAAPRAREAVRRLAPDLPVERMRPLADLLDEAVGFQRFNMALMLVFGALAVALAAVGLFAVLAHRVGLRTRELGIRVALGARPGSVAGLVMRDGMRLVAVGVVTGLAGAWALTRFAEAFLFGVSPTDPATFAALSALLLVVGAAACYLPARRATRIDPRIALSSE